MSQRPPVKDWATDFDHLDPRWIEDPFPIWDELRQKCPIAHTERFNGVYLPTRYEDVRAIAYDPEHFSSRKVIVRESPPPANNGAPPITSDPPRHRLARMALLPPFTLPRDARVDMDVRVLTFTLGLSVVTGIVFGLAPALQVTKPDLSSAMKEGGRGSSGEPPRARHRCGTRAPRERCVPRASPR